MATPRRVFRQAVDDSELSTSGCRQALTFEEQLKQKAMTLGRKPKRFQEPELSGDASPPPPPPARLHSRRGSQGPAQINDCTSTSLGRQESSQSSEKRPHIKPRRAVPHPQSGESPVSNGTGAQVPRSRKHKPLVSTPSYSQEHASDGTGIAAARAMLQAKFAGEQVSSSEYPQPPPPPPVNELSPALPPRNATANVSPKPSRATMQNELQSAFASLHSSNTSAGEGVPVSSKPNRAANTTVQNELQSAFGARHNSNTSTGEGLPVSSKPTRAANTSVQNKLQPAFGSRHNSNTSTGESLPVSSKPTRAASTTVQNELQSAFASHRSSNTSTGEQGEIMEKEQFAPKPKRRLSPHITISPSRNTPTPTQDHPQHNSSSNSLHEEYNCESSGHSSVERRASLIKESSSVESLCSREESPPRFNPPPLPPKDLEQPKPRNKPMRSTSFKSTMWRSTKQTTAEEKGAFKDKRMPTRPFPADVSQNQPDPDFNLLSQLSLQQLSGQVDLSTVISKGASFFPMCVKVCRGYCSSTCPESFSKYDRLYLHFIKHSKVGILKDECSDEQYTIPLSSKLEFGILYDGEGASMSELLRTVADVMKLKPLPLVIQAQQSFDGGSPEKSVKEKELLFPKKIVKSSILSKTKVLEVQTIDYQLKQLSLNCEGEFSLHPVHVKMNLSMLSEQSLPLPQRVYLLCDKTEFEKYLPDTMIHEPVVIQSIGGETSVICTVKDDDASEEKSIMDISNHFGIQIQIEPIVDEQERQQLHKNTLQLYDSLNPSNLKCVIEKQTKREYDLQCVLNQELIEGREVDGIHFQLPTLLSSTEPPLPAKSLPSVPPIDHPPSEPVAMQAEPAEITSMASSEELDAHSVTSADQINDYEDVASALAELPAEETNKLTKVMNSKKKSSLNSKLLSRFKTKFKKHEGSHNYEETEIKSHQSPVPPPSKKDVRETSTGPSGMEPEENYEPVDMEESIDGDSSDVRLSANRSLPSQKSAPGSSTEQESNYAILSKKIDTLTSELQALKLQVQTLSTTVESLVSEQSTTVERFGREQSTTVERSVESRSSGEQSSAGSQQAMQEKEETMRNKDYLKTLSNKQVSVYVHTHTHMHTHTHTHFYIDSKAIGKHGAIKLQKWISEEISKWGAAVTD